MKTYQKQAVLFTPYTRKVIMFNISLKLLTDLKLLSGFLDIVYYEK